MAEIFSTLGAYPPPEPPGSRAVVPADMHLSDFLKCPAPRCPESLFLISKFLFPAEAAVVFAALAHGDLPW